jgi:hypothetical protein
VAITALHARNNATRQSPPGIASATSPISTGRLRMIAAMIACTAA